MGANRSLRPSVWSLKIENFHMRKEKENVGSRCKEGVDYSSFSLGWSKMNSLLLNHTVWGICHRYHIV